MAAKAATVKAQDAAFARFEANFEKNFGEGTLLHPEETVDNPYNVISTGSLSLDEALVVGGYVEGRIVEVYGPEGVGKSTLAMFAVAEAQKKHPDKWAGWIDVEHVWDDRWGRAHGINLSRVKPYQPNNAEDVGDAMKDMLMSGLFSIVVVDSIGALIPQKQKDKAADEATVGDTAKIVTRMVNIAISEAHNNDVTVFVINQQRANIAKFGADTTTAGGWALKYSSTMKLKMQRTGQKDPLYDIIKGEKVAVGHFVSVRVERNKVAAGYRTANMVLYHAPSKYGPVGIDKADEAVTVGLRNGVIGQAGAWYTLPNGERYNGREALVEGVREDPDSIVEIRRLVLEANEQNIILDEIAGE